MNTNKKLRAAHRHGWIFGVLGLVAGGLLMVYVPRLSPVAQSILWFAGFHLVGAIVILATLWYGGARERLRRPAENAAAYDFGWDPGWTVGLALAALIAAASAAAVQVALPNWWPAAWVLLIEGGSFFVGFLMMLVYRGLDGAVLPMANLLSGDRDLVLDAGCGAGRTSIALGRALKQGRIVAYDRFDASYIDGGGRALLDRNLRLADLSERVRVETGDLAAMPFGDGQFRQRCQHQCLRPPRPRHRNRAARDLSRPEAGRAIPARGVHAGLGHVRRGQRPVVLSEIPQRLARPGHGRGLCCGQRMEGQRDLVRAVVKAKGPPMNTLSAALAQDAFSWFFIPSALALGALHGLEPGHSKTMMAAFIVTIRGTARQAILLALAATFSHTAVVWIVAMGGLAFGQTWLSPASEPYFELASAVLVIAVGLWMLLRRLSADRHTHAHDHHDHHAHDHHDHHAHDHQAAHGLDLERLHNQTVTTGQIVVFGLTGGLIPCPAAITVLLLCLQTHRLWTGALLALCFSVGLAMTLMAAGLAAAYGLGQVTRRLPRLESLLARAPYAVSLITLAMGCYLGAAAWRSL